MRQRLFGKYFLASSLIVLFSLTVMMTILTFVYNGYLATVKYDNLEKTCNAISDFLGENYRTLDFSDKGLKYITENLAEVSDIDVFITDMSGKIMLCSCQDSGSEDCHHYGKQISRDIIGQVSAEPVREISSVGIYKNPRYMSASPIEISGKQEGLILSTAPVTAIKELMKKASKLYLFSAIVPITVMFFAVYFMTYRLTKPIKIMSGAARSMAKGDFSRRIPVTSDDEIGELAVAFNQMTNSLARLEDMRKSFVADVSHELKTPMTTIGGFIDGIIDGTIEPEKQKYYLEIVSQEIKRLSRMVQSMLSVSKLESGEFVLKPEKFDFRELLFGVVISLEQRIEQKEINIKGLDALDSVTINADKDLIHRVVYNLVDNAVKFTNEGGSIDFSLRVDSKNMTFKISNTGRGIPSSALPYVFERFYKVDKSRSANKNSTGLGLYIVKTIIKNHGGNITVMSKEGELTAFEVTLPLSK